MTLHWFTIILPDGRRHDHLAASRAQAEDNAARMYGVPASELVIRYRYSVVSWPETGRGSAVRTRTQRYQGPSPDEVSRAAAEIRAKKLRTKAVPA